MSKIRPFVGKPLVKVLTGIRRCGKSTLLQLLQQEFLTSGVHPDHIIYMNFESMTHIETDNARKLYEVVKERIRDKGIHYILLDEVQAVDQWEKAVNSFLVDFPCDIFITGSNSRLLSSELTTLLTGRYVEIHIDTLSFAEHILFEHRTEQEPFADKKELFQKYLRTGGFPLLHVTSYREEDAWQIVRGIYHSILFQDVVQRNRIRDAELLSRIALFVLDNVGHLFSIKKVADYLKSQHRPASPETIANYMDALEQAYLITRVSRYDLRGKALLQNTEKFYVGDHGLIHAMFGYKARNVAGILENIVFHELRLRGYSVTIGQLFHTEIDFVAEKLEKRIYIQVAMEMRAEETRSRELGPLLGLKDHYPKYVVTLDEGSQDNVEGVRCVYLPEFLLSDLF